MMKNVVLILSLMLVGIGHAQHSTTVKGGSYFTAKWGASKYSFPTLFEAQYGFAFGEKVSVRSGLLFEYGKINQTRLKIGAVSLDLLYNVVSIKEKVYFNMGLGGAFGIEGLSSLPDPSIRRRTFIISAKGFVGAEMPLGKNLSLGIEFAQWYDQFSQLGPLHYTGSININYSIK